MQDVADMMSMLFASRDQAHMFHLQTGSYAMHKALDTYYNEIIAFVDDYVEMFQGRYGLIKGYMPASKYFEGDDQVIPYFTGLALYVDGNRSKLPIDTDLNNVMDEISGLIRSTIYKLTFLK